MIRKIVSVTFFSMFLATQLNAKTCEIAVEGTDQMQYNTKEITIGKDCKDVKITLKHAGKLPKAAMGHNLIISKAADKDALIKAATGAGPTGDYTPKSDKIIAATKLLGGGESATITFDAKKVRGSKDEFVFFCTFPGHSALMTGKVIVK